MAPYSLRRTSVGTLLDALSLGLRDLSDDCGTEQYSTTFVRPPLKARDIVKSN